MDQRQQDQERLQMYYAASQFDQVPLFDSKETQAFEKFLDELVVDNQFIFNPRIPANLDGTLGLASHKREEAAFDRLRRAPLAFNTDPLFAADGYRGTHKFVPVGYGHSHPAFTAQKSPRSSDVSRSTSRARSVAAAGSALPLLQAAATPDLSEVSGLGFDAGVTGAAQVTDQSVNRGHSVGGYKNAANDYDTLLHAIMPEQDTRQHRKSLSMPVKRPSTPTISTEPEADPSSSRLSATKRPRSSSHGAAKRLAGTSTDQPSDGSPSYPSATNATHADAEASAAKKTLTAAQKRQNHITSEQKRRNLIKDGFEALSQLLPTVRGHGVSKHFILTEAVTAVKRLQRRRDVLLQQVQALEAKR